MADSIIKELITYLLTVTEITDVVGNKIKPGVISQTRTPPYICVSTFYSETNQLLSGNDDFVMKAIKIDCVAYKYSEMDQLHEIVRENLDTFQQASMGPFWINSTRIEDEFEEHIEPKASDQKWTYVKSGIYEIHFPQKDANV